MALLLWNARQGRYSIASSFCLRPWKTSNLFFRGSHNNATNMLDFIPHFDQLLQKMYFDSIIPNPRPSSLNQKHFFNGEKPCSFYLNGDVITLNKVLGEKLKYRPWFWNAGAASRNNCSEQTAFNVALFVPLPSWLWFQLQFFLYFKIERPIKLACIFNHQIMTWSTVWTDCTKWRPNSPAAPFFHFSKEDLIEFADVLGNRKPDRTFPKKEA